MLSAVQIYNNPLIGFKTESFIVLSLIAWTYLLHAYYVRRKLSTATTSKRSNGENFCEMPMAAFAIGT